MKKDKIICIVFNSNTDSAYDINIENPKTYVGCATVYIEDGETGEIKIKKKSVESLLKEKEKDAMDRLIRKDKIISFGQFIEKNYGVIYLLPFNCGIIFNSIKERTK